MKNPLKRNKNVKTTQTLLLPDALKKLVELDVACLKNNKYVYSKSFEDSVVNIRNGSLGKMKQIKYGQEAGRYLVPQFVALGLTKPSRTDIENLVTAFVCLKVHVENNSIEVDKNIIPDLAYAVWYLNDHEPTVEDVDEGCLV